MQTKLRVRTCLEWAYAGSAGVSPNAAYFLQRKRSPWSAAACCRLFRASKHRNKCKGGSKLPHSIFSETILLPVLNSVFMETIESYALS
jgi:hypothetical protein